jgi:hypothetical protein
MLGCGGQHKAHPTKLILSAFAPLREIGFRSLSPFKLSSNREINYAKKRFDYWCE